MPEGYLREQVSPLFCAIFPRLMKKNQKKEAVYSFFFVSLHQ